MSAAHRCASCHEVNATAKVGLQGTGLQVASKLIPLLLLVCRYQKKLQDNLMTLAALADAQATPQQQAQQNPGQAQPGAPPQ